MRVLVAPDKFRGTLTARQAADAIESGWHHVRPDDELDLAPMADGGEGTLNALVDAMRGSREGLLVRGPLGDRVRAPVGLASRGDGLLAVVEMARASGLELVPANRRDPLRASTFGTGELILRGLERGATRVVVCLGGSATNDGGSGMAAALGVRFLNERGQALPPGGAALLHLAHIDATAADPRIAAVRFLGASDVDNPLTGPTGASTVYGPQKGASTDDIAVLDDALGHLAAVVHRDLGIDLRDQPGAGAAGGLGFGMMAFCGARLRPGVEVVIDALGLQGRMEGADLVVTGEGSFDAQSLHGKVPAGVMALADLSSVPVAIICGRAEVQPAGVAVVSLTDRVGGDAALGDAQRSLELVAQELAARAPELTGTPA